ncbi:LOW QUALITY PROTEIN: U3 small nucleolar ribonucleoprotein protein MPP10 [Tachyglossus aculeatus]|uniref:LOW QUALITY PROTEIN: U3 small nucleolar ribonucleoprotein protein MPP10 n=1 Tax=Tachyglossus aculeatus TaxID=9261 RepID=UPI0018F43B62|nr:LOW QUALITY PROTEIN: U3 small nucleolar ribonucleoprotein protein MPP10 [Tachyglossus aculeatus]
MARRRRGPSSRLRLLERCLRDLDGATARPELFLSVQDGLASNFTSLTKTLYDLHKTIFSRLGSPLKTLTVKNFDDEQIWQQLELQNDAILQHFKSAVNRSLTDEKLCLLPATKNDVVSKMEAGRKEDTGQKKESHLKPGSLGEKKGGDKKKNEREANLAENSTSDEEAADLDFDIDKLQSQIKKTKVFVKRREKSIVDDKFFKLSEMDAYLEHVEKDEEKGDGERDIEDEIDYFEDIHSDDEGLFEDKNRKSAESARNLTYKDFFDPVESDEDVASDPQMSEDFGEEDGSVEGMSEEDEEEIKENKDKKQQREALKRVSFALPEEDGDDDISDEDDDEDEEDEEIKEDTDRLGKEKHSVVKSSFEKREEKMTERIKSLEKELLEPKPWQLQGEVTGQKRPENSLLEETLHFDHAVRMAPVITEETTFQLEDMIKQRIRDQAWDDVVRKEKPKEEAFEYKKRLTLDHEKSKLSLAEIYEQEYLKLHQEKTEEEEENPEHVEIQKMMDSLFLKLDALSNFHFTPKPPVPEIKVVSNLPAISMEEVAPVSVSDAALLAPEEVKEKNKAGDIKTSAEMTATDKKRERRKKKLRKRMKLKEKERRQKLLAQTKPELAKKFNKNVASAQLKKLTKAGKASLLKDEGKDKALKSSQAFFSQLQDQVKMQIREGKKVPKKRKQQEMSVRKLKL